jgi:DNA-directed RNA polymerase specialized sigma subunit
MSNALLARPKMSRRRVKKHPPLTREQQKLVEEHGWIAGRLAYSAKCLTGGQTGTMTKEDLESVAYFALCVSASRYRPEFGFKFSTYAWNTARGYIQHALRDFSRMVRTPRWVEIYKKRVDNFLKEGKTYEQVAELLSISYDMVIMCEESSFNYHVSYDSGPEDGMSRGFIFNVDEAKATLISPSLLAGLKEMSEAEMLMMERYVDGNQMSEAEHEWCAEKFHELRAIAYGQSEEV